MNAFPEAVLHRTTYHYYPQANDELTLHEGSTTRMFRITRVWTDAEGKFIEGQFGDEPTLRVRFEFEGGGVWFYAMPYIPTVWERLAD